MNATYPLLIQEDVAQLQAVEKAARDKARTDRLRLLRFLKEERVAGVSQAAAVLGYSLDYSRRRWVWREPVSGRRVWLSTPIRALGAPTHRDGRYACPAQPVTGW